MSKGLNKQQLRILVFVWIGVVVLVGICVFLGILAALGNSDRAGDAPEGQALGVTPTMVQQAAQPTPIPDTGSQPTIAPTLAPNQDTSFGYGIQIQAHINTEPTLEQVQQLGFGWVKQQIRWSDLEPVEGEPNWAALDPIFEATSRRGLKVLVSIVAAPDWARSVTAEGQEGPPDDPQKFATYVGQLAQRYSGAIHAIEVWNEQNLQREWYTGGGLTAQGYVNLLIPTSQAIRAADPNILILSGALTPTGVDDGVLAINDLRYMQEMLAAGMLDYVDCVGAHHNGINLPPDQSAEEAFAGGAPEGTVFIGPFDNGNPLNPHHSWSFYSTLTGYHDLIVAAGGDTPLCVTEFGWSSVEGMDGAPREGFEFAYDNSLDDQTENIQRAFELMHEWGWVRMAILFNLDFSPKAGGDTQDDSALFSILNPDGSPRPAFDAVSSMPKPP